MMRTDKVAIVMGGAFGIGEAIAHRFAHEGAAVVIAGLTDSAAQDVADAMTALGGEAVAYLGDLSDEADAKACVSAAVGAFGRLDILASNAGVFIAMDEVDTRTTESVDYMNRLNTRPGFPMTKCASAAWRRRRDSPAIRCPTC